MRRYARILRRPAALVPFTAATVARLPISMAPLGLVLLVQSVRGSYAVAGLVTAAFALGSAVASPGWGMLLDRMGQPRVIGPTSVASAAFLAAVALAAVGGAGDVPLAVLAAGAGLTFPPVSPAMRALWRVVLHEDADRRAAYALDAVAIEAIFVGGPLLLAVLLLARLPALPLLVTAALMAGGGLVYCVTPAARAWRAAEHPPVGPAGEPDPDAVHARMSPLRARGVAAVLGVAVLISVGFGLHDVAIAATAREVLDRPARVGLLFAAVASGSVTGGLWYGSRHWVGPERRRMPVAMGLFTVGLVTIGTMLHAGRPSLLALMATLFVTGLSIAPAMIIQANLVDQLGPRDRLGEAQSWLTTAYTSGGAAGTAAAGVLVDAGGPGRAFFGAAAAVAVATVAGVLAQPSWRRPAGGDSRDEPVRDRTQI